MEYKSIKKYINIKIIKFSKNEKITNNCIKLNCVYYVYYIYIY